MKKLIIYILTLSLLLSTLSISASANEISDKNNRSLEEPIEIFSDEPKPRDIHND